LTVGRKGSIMVKKANLKNHSRDLNFKYGKY